MKNIIGFLILTVFLVGCGTSTKNMPDNNEFISNETPESQSKTNDKDFRKLIKEANLRFRTKSNEETYNLLKNSIKGFEAYISEEHTFNYSNQTGYDLTIRVPSEKFDSLLNYVVENANIKELDNKSTQINDVTEEFIDIQARIKIKKESEQKLSELLSQAKNLTEVLEIQKQQTDLLAEIESIEGRLKYLTDQINFSTIRISFYENIKYSNRFFGDFWDALKDGMQVFLHVLTLLAYLWVVILVFFLIRWGYKYYKKRSE